MSDIEGLFEKLNADNAPGQESRNQSREIELKGEMCEAPFVELSYENMADAAKGSIKVMENYGLKPF